MRDALKALGIVVALLVFLLWVTKDETPGLGTTTIHHEENLKITDPGTPIEAARARHEAIKKSDSERTQGSADPIQRVLVTEDSSYGVVVEVGPILGSTIGQVLQDCVGLRDPNGLLATLSKSGIDLPSAIDRVALIEGGVIVSGNFDSITPILPFWGKDGGKKYGDRGRMFAMPDFGFGLVHGAIWKDEILIAAKSEKLVERTIDRLESRGPEGTPLVPEGEAYGNVYGTFDVGDVAPLLGQPVDWLGAGGKKAVFHADVENQLYQSIELPVGPEARDDLKKKIDAFVAERRAAVPKAPMPMDANLGAAIDGVTAMPLENGLRIDAIVPTRHLQNWLASCRLGLPHAPPPGWEVTPQAMPPGFVGPEPRGMVGLSHNSKMMKETYPDLAKIIEDSQTDAALNWIDPLSLQMVSFSYKTRPGLCARIAQMETIPDVYGPIANIEDSKKRQWHRSSKIQPQSGTGSAGYSRCVDDHLWELTIGYQKRVALSVVFARYEAYLGELELTKP